MIHKLYSEQKSIGINNDDFLNMQEQQTAEKIDFGSSKNPKSCEVES